MSFPFSHPVEVRFRDLDAMGHAHHSLPLIYVEEARAAFWRKIRGQAGLDAIDYVMAEVNVRFHEPIFFPQQLTIGLRIGHIGVKSFGMEFEIRGKDGRLFASGRTMQVMYDYETRTSKPVPSDLRLELEAYRVVQ